MGDLLNRPVERVEVFEVETEGANRRRLKIGNIDNLLSRKITGIQLWKIGDVSIAPSGRPVVADAVFIKSFLTLSIQGEERISEVPLTAFHQPTNNGFRFELDEKVINWENSFIEIAENTGVNDTDSFVFQIHYIK